MSDANNKNDQKNQIFKDEEGLLLDHDYDGIQELDHPLPFWWLGILWGTVIFSVFYVAYYMVGSGPSLEDELLVDLKKIEDVRPKNTADLFSNETIVAHLKDAGQLAQGKEVFASKCAACHGPNGEGLIGPNLTDNFWLHGSGAPKDVAMAIYDGVAEKGMPPWGPVLSTDELINVTAFIRSLHGTEPTNAKAPQGNEFEFVEM